MQQRMSIKSFLQFKSYRAEFLLSVLWLLGLVCGALVGSEYSEVLAGHLIAACVCEPTFILHLLILLIPLLITVAGGAFFHLDSILLVVFGKGFCLSVVLAACVTVFHNSGWFICFLLLFSDWLGSLVYLCIWLLILKTGKISKAYILAALFSLTAITLADCRFVAPILISLFTA